MSSIETFFMSHDRPSDDTMETDEGTSSAPEKSLSTLKSFARMAGQDCDVPLTDATGIAKVRQEIYSTWMLLLLIHHAEAECDRCSANFKPKKWRTEAQGLRHLFLHDRSARILSAVLRWLRWAHSMEDIEDAPAEGDASYERTRRAMQLKSGLPLPLQAAPALHPDGPLQQTDRFDKGDLEDEHRLLRSVFVHLRRGDLAGALKLCGAQGQAWRTALLEGMMPFADAGDEPVGYDGVTGDEDEDFLARLKEEFTDWTELGVLEGSSQNQGNPWRRLWKEQCWDVAQRNLRPGSTMDLYELAIYGFCSGHHEALLAFSGNATWADRCWAELHCLKEGLVERLLNVGHEEWCHDPKLLLGEGDGGVPDVMDTSDDRTARDAKLSGRFQNVSAADLEALVSSEATRFLNQLRDDPSVPARLRQQATSPFARLQAMIIEAAWEPAKFDVALEMLRSWLADGFDGAPCPFLVKQFASYFAMWRKDCAGTSQQQLESAVPASPPSATPDVDDIVRSLVRELVSNASGSWVEECLEGNAIELIVEHVSALQASSRLDAYSTFLMELCGKAMAAEKAAESLRLATVLEKCVLVFWRKFPTEVFPLLAVLVRRALGTASATVTEDQIDGIGPIGVSAAATVTNMAVALHCLAAFWVVVRDRAGNDLEMEEAFLGLEQLLGEVPAGLSDAVCSDDLARIVLDSLVLPLTLDSLLCLVVKDADSALDVLSMLQGSLLWQDSFSSGRSHAEGLAELEWYLRLQQKREEWATAFSRCGVKVDTQSEESLAREGLLDWARMRLTRDHALLDPIAGSKTTIAAAHWENMRKALAYRVLEALLSAFEQACDFDGATHDLAVVIAQSPWMLRLVPPEVLRSFLLRISLIPLRLNGLGTYYSKDQTASCGIAASGSFPTALRA